ncbi:MAG: hypothetical protein GOU98_04680 [Candidatus Altiarchaeota archaeon]|nr:hypothetical protein [Candidatus Altiarchaeota archaeon]
MGNIFRNIKQKIKSYKSCPEVDNSFQEEASEGIDYFMNKGKEKFEKIRGDSQENMNLYNEALGEYNKALDATKDSVIDLTKNTVLYKGSMVVIPLTLGASTIPAIYYGFKMGNDVVMSTLGSLNSISSKRTAKKHLNDASRHGPLIEAEEMLENYQEVSQIA